ncbi:SCO6745 family protein [Streptomyces narbonensis]|uniref:SCO6745 family protein n=1 Tax=Streptomyces narbonensis TaxID=67333 RepID=UPI003F53E611
MTAAQSGERSYEQRCAQAVNALHSISYFTPDLGVELERFGVTDPLSVYMACRSAPLGAVDAPVVTAVFHGFAPAFVAERVPAVWDSVSPKQAILARQKAIGTALERLLGSEVIRSEQMAEAAKLATAAAWGASFPGRPLYAANAALDQPDEPHIALWHAATMLREHRGDGHAIVLGHLELIGAEALVLDCASELGMPKEVVMPQRGWSEQDWSAAQERLVDRELIDGAGTLTARGVALREEMERETCRLDRAPYTALSETDVEKLALYVRGLVTTAADSGAFMPQLREFFAPAAEAWNRL